MGTVELATQAQNLQAMVWRSFDEGSHKAVGLLGIGRECRASYRTGRTVTSSTSKWLSSSMGIMKKKSEVRYTK